MLQTVSFKEHITFDKKCLAEQVIPNKLYVKPFANLPAAHKAAKACSLEFLKIRISQAKSEIFFKNKRCESKLKQLKEILPDYIINLIKSRSAKKFEYEKNKIRLAHDKKFKNLLYKYRPYLKAIDNQKKTNENVHGETSAIRENWLVNLSSKTFDDTELSVLKLDPKYQVTPKFINFEQIVANIESKLDNLIENQSTLESVRLSIINAIKVNRYNSRKSNLSRDQYDAIKRLKSYDNIIITNSDKGNKTVVLNRCEYIAKVDDILSDKKIYQEIIADNTNTIAKQLISKLKVLKESEYINYFQHKYIYPSSYEIPCVYALIKLHKINTPARLICPYFGHPLAKLSKFLSDIITPCIRNSKYSIKSPAQFAEEVQTVKLSLNDVMISLDVVNLFTNVPINLTLKIIEKNLKNDNTLIERTNLPVFEIINLIKFCMINTCFTFNDKFYKQISGAPMGSNLSPIFAEALVSEIFEIAINSFDIKPKFARFFVDDSFIILNNRYIDKFYNFMNKLGDKYEKVQFTIEKEIDNSLAFLDLKLTRTENTIKTSVYRKPTHSCRYLNFYSHHSLDNRKSVIRSQITRTFKYCSDKTDLDGKLNETIKILRASNYPLNLIQKVIDQCKNKIENPSTQEKTEFELEKVIAIPYYRGLSEEIRNILRKQDINVVFKRGFTIKNMLSSNKKQDLEKSNVVYSVGCSDCPAKYVGHTKRHLRERLAEHKKALDKPYIKSNIADHAKNFNHKINFNNPVISYRENNYQARRRLESWEIIKNKNLNIPLMNDQQNSQTSLPQIYASLLD